MPPRNDVITLRVTKEEKDRVRQLAGKFRLSVSGFVRAAVVEARIPEPWQKKSAAALLEANADLARLGNLLHLGISEGTFTEQRVSGLLAEIRASQKAVVAQAVELGGKKKE